MWQKMLQIGSGGAEPIPTISSIIPIMTNWTQDGFTVPNISSEYYGSYYSFNAFGNSSHWHSSIVKDASYVDILFPNGVNPTYIGEISFNTNYIGEIHNCKVKIETLDSSGNPFQTVYDERVKEESVSIIIEKKYHKFNGLRITMYSKTNVSNGFGINGFKLIAG